jgi:hypothetical protein
MPPPYWVQRPNWLAQKQPGLQRMKQLYTTRWQQ